MFQKISHRLALLIVVALVGLLLSSANGLYQLNRSNQIVVNTGQNTLPSVDKLGQAKSDFLEVRVNLYSHLLMKDFAQMGTIEANLRKSAKKVKEALDFYETKLLTDEADKALLQEDKRTVNDYLAAMEQAITLSRDNQDEEAADYLAKTLHDKGTAALAALDKHTAMNSQQAAADVVSSAKSFSAALYFSLTLVVLTTVLLLVVAWTTYRGVVGTTAAARLEVLRVVSDLDFSRNLKVTGHDEVSELLRAFNTLIEKLRAGLREIQEGANSLNEASAELSLAATQVGNGSQSQADAAAAMAANVEEVTVSINHVTEQTAEANALVREAGQQAQDGRGAMQGVTSQIENIASLVNDAANEIQRLEESGRQIGSVVNVIKEVADQTNLLALNAAIEAARAGEQGRGFAVVADEVRKLAERTATSTLEISKMVGDIQQRSRDVAGRMGSAVESVRSGVEQSQITQQSMNQIAERAQSSVQLVDEVAASLREQSAASNAIATQVERVAQMSEENSQAALRSTDLSSHLTQLADSMLKVVRTYRL